MTNLDLTENQYSVINDSHLSEQQNESSKFKNDSANLNIGDQIEGNDKPLHQIYEQGTEEAENELDKKEEDEETPNMQVHISAKGNHSLIEENKVGDTTKQELEDAIGEIDEQPIKSDTKVPRELTEKELELASKVKEKDEEIARIIKANKDIKQKIKEANEKYQNILKKLEEYPQGEDEESLNARIKEVDAEISRHNLEIAKLKSSTDQLKNKIEFKMNLNK